LNREREENILRAGTKVVLLMQENLTTEKKILGVGQFIQVEVASSITVNGITVISGCKSLSGK
jgi:hypothetical protein